MIQELIGLDPHVSFIISAFRSRRKAAGAENNSEEKGMTLFEVLRTYLASNE